MKNLVQVKTTCQGYDYSKIYIELWDDGTFYLGEQRRRGSKYELIDYLETRPDAPVAACLAALVDETSTLWDDDISERLMLGVTSWLNRYGIGGPSQLSRDLTSAL